MTVPPKPPRRQWPQVDGFDCRWGVPLMAPIAEALEHVEPDVREQFLDQLEDVTYNSLISAQN